ncbi:MAG: glycosyltransferase [Bacteroidota bacterium]
MDLPGKKVVVSVISDLVTDQRVHRTCLTMREQGAHVLLVGRQLRSSLEMSSRPYYFKRFRLWFERGPLFYAVFNLRLFFFLIFEKADLLVANDLDTLPANFFASKIKGIPLIYDSHEYFTEVPELVNRPLVRNFWKRIEKAILPKLKHVITVNESIAELYSKEYDRNVKVVRNIPISDPFGHTSYSHKSHRSDYGLPEDRFIFLMQGSGINMQRGAEEALEAIARVNGALLLIVGGGDVIEILKARSKDPGLSGKVIFLPKLPLQELRKVTILADAGLSLDKDTNINYRFSLPNKLFDYIHANIPVLVSDLPEVAKIVRKYDIGIIAPSVDPETIARCMREMMLQAHDRLVQWKENLNFAASELDWRNERERLLDVVRDVS